MENELTLLGQKYININTFDSIVIPDCFVHRRNKLDYSRGNGEAKLYIGSRKSIEIQSFFKKTSMTGFLLKRDLLEYLQDAKFEYENKEQVYRENITDYWLENNKMLERKEQVLFFEFTESPAGGDSRYYISSMRGDVFYKEFRKIVLPEITYISILKLKNIDNKEVFYFRPYLNYFYDPRHHSAIIAEKEKEIQEDKTLGQDKKKEIIYARKGQGKYRTSVIDEMGECLITRVNDERMLIASHIKPWAVCENDRERIDKYNGLLLTPTYDRLFDQGFITFSNEGKIFVSPYLSPLNTKRLGLIPNKQYDLSLHARRSDYLEYHRQCIFKKG
ncbi:HNH endonuclease [Candidatus Tisiphia endosymbiont of Temnostethus pusillus]|uniref:HNH endonuclease n=3 Tax=unclassified Candidatus Tisiphia TaxID=2996318 RepID=UPI0035C89296